MAGRSDRPPVIRVHLTHFSNHALNAPVLVEPLKAAIELPWEGLNCDPAVPPLRGLCAMTATSIVGILGPKRKREQDLEVNFCSPDVEVEPSAAEIK